MNQTMCSRAGSVAVFTCLLLWAGAQPFAQDVQSILTATGAKGGLAVTVGVSDGALEAELASSAYSFLVQGIYTDLGAVASARVKVARAKKFPLANISHVDNNKNLPYADNLVNLLIVDLDKLGNSGPSTDEIRRVLGFNGKAHIKQGGAWKVIDNPMPPDVDEWPYQFYDAKRRPVSKDMRAGIWSGLKWIGGPRKIGGDIDIRIEGGVTYVIRPIEVGSSKIKNANLPKAGYLLMARDAFSGVLLWTARAAIIQGGRTGARTGGVCLVAHSGKVFAYPDSGGYLTAYNGRTGAIVRVYDKTIKPTPIFSKARDADACHAISHSAIFFDDGKMFQTYRNHIWMLNEETGEILWHHQEVKDSNWIWGAAPGDDGDIYMFVTARGPDGGFKDGVRGHMPYLKAAQRLNASDGNVVWRNEEAVKGYMGVFVGGPADGVFPTLLGAFKDSTVPVLFSGGDGIGTCVLSAADGKILWRKNLTNPPNWSSVGIHIIDKKIHITDAYNDQVFEPATGERLVDIRLSTHNEDNPGCMGLSMTPKYYIRGPRLNARSATLPSMVNGKSPYLTAFMSQGFRPHCGEVTSPAYGMMYCPGTMCGCAWYLPGDVTAYRAEPVTPIDASKRLISGSDGLKGVVVSGAVEALDKTGSIRDDWMMAVDYTSGVKPTRLQVTTYTPTTMPPPWNCAVTTTPATSGDITIQSIIHENKIEARRSGSVVWTFLSAGRISVAPSISGDLVIFGCHDGWVYAVKLSDGSLAWRYFAAPMERRIVAYGQVESAWPLYGVLVQGGTVYYMAGRSACVDEGMFAGALEAGTGKSKWRIRIAQYESAKYAQYINGPLSISGGKIAYFGPSLSTSGQADIITGTPPSTGVSSRKPRNMDAGWEKTGAVRIKVVDVQGRMLKTYFGDPAVGRDLKRILPPGYYVVVPEQSSGTQKVEPHLFIKR